MVAGFAVVTTLVVVVVPVVVAVVVVVVSEIIVVVVVAGVVVAALVEGILSSKHSEAQSEQMESLVLPALNCLPAGTFSLQIVRNTESTSMQFIPSLTSVFCDGPLYVMVTLALMSLMSILPTSTSHTPGKTGETQQS